MISNFATSEGFRNSLIFMSIFYSYIFLVTVCNSMKFKELKDPGIPEIRCKIILKSTIVLTYPIAHANFYP